MSKILIAEDDKYLSSAYRVKFTKAGFETQIASDGIEAFDILKKFTPDIILLDLVMPRKDGFTTLEELKKNPKYKKIPVIITSNLGQQEDIDKCKQLGAKEYIVKSDMSLDDLVSKITSILK